MSLRAAMTVLGGAAAAPPGPSLILPTSITVSDTVTGSAAFAFVDFSANGNLFATTAAFPPFGMVPDAWFTEEVDNVGFDYEARFDVSSGALSSGTPNAWVAIDSGGLVFGRNRPTAGVSEVTGILRVREKANPSNEVSCPITLTAERI